MSRLANARKAIRPALKGRMMLAGPPGSGKTRSALMIGETLAATLDEDGKVTDPGRVLVIDTERESALTYADDFTFEHLTWDPPFDPRELTTVLGEAGASYDVVIVDSLTHFWQATGGTLDIANGKFTGWKEARPAQEDLVRAILSADAHVLVCVRSKMKHEQVVEDGKHKVHKLGMGPIQDADLEYEVNVSVSIDMGHTLAIAKSRTTALPVGREFKPGHAVDLAVLYRDWLKGGEPPADRAVIDALVTRLNALPDAARASAKQEFVAMLGRPEHLTESQVTDAEALVTRHEIAGRGGEAPEAPTPNGTESADPAAAPLPGTTDNHEQETAR